MTNFVVASLLFAALDIFVAILSFKKGGMRGNALALTCVGCAVVALSYLGSAFSDGERLFSCLSSLYFVSIDFMLFCLVVFVLDFCRIKRTNLGYGLMKVAFFYAIFDALIFTANIFTNVAVSYVPRATPLAKFGYDMHGLFYVHLFYCYVLVATVVVALVYKIIRVPLEYKRQYLYSLLGLCGVVGCNAIFLFMPRFAKYSYLDLSIFGYSLGVYAFYWACFNYSTKGMMNLFKMSVFENLEQGLVLFDYSGRLILFNAMAGRLWPTINFKYGMDVSEFQNLCKIDVAQGIEDCVLQCYAKNENEIKPLRCDYRVVKNARGRVLGFLYMFSNAELATDPLTGFHNWENFKFMVEENGGKPRNPIVVVACDIVGLSLINSTNGRHVGDMKIKALADSFRAHFPKDSYFVRGQESDVIAIQILEDEKSAVENLELIKNEMDVSIQYAVNVVAPTKDFLEGIEETVKGLRQKKLLNKDSSHSVILKSLVQALQECDADTEEHVKRTQAMGALLGKRIGLTDVQQSDLSLLCLLHDIGKIGVPLEILNKPGKLTADEWRVLRSHAVKGYQIANSSPELCGIANMILHHHERWDGAGYPDGLSRESIPLLSRIIAVVDAYDAMVNDRSYRPALPQEMAINELKRCAGTQFDPGIVSEFIQLIESMPKLPEKKTANPLDEDKAKEMVREELTQGSEENASFHAVHNLAFARYIVDDKFNIISVDKGFEELCGYTQEEVTQNHINHMDLIPKENRTEYLKLVMKVLAKKPQAFFEHRLVRKDGTIAYVFCLGRQYFDSAARAGRSEIIVTDAASTYSLRVIADVERDHARTRKTEWENAFRKDPLTGVLTRDAFKNDTEYKLLEGKTKVMLLMVDVDHFKN